MGSEFQADGFGLLIPCFVGHGGQAGGKVESGEADGPGIFAFHPDGVCGAGWGMLAVKGFVTVRMVRVNDLSKLYVTFRLYVR